VKKDNANFILINEFVNNAKFEDNKNKGDSNDSKKSSKKKSRSVSNSFSDSSNSEHKEIEEDIDQNYQRASPKFISQKFDSLNKSLFHSNLREDKTKKFLLNKDEFSFGKNEQNNLLSKMPKINGKYTATKLMATQDFKSSMKILKSDCSSGRVPIRLPSHIDETYVNKNSSTKKTPQINLMKLEKQSPNNGGKRSEGESSSESINKNHEYFKSFLSKSLFTSKFQIFWTIILFLAHTYHMLAFWYYLAIVNYPKGYLLGMQTFFEFFLLIDFLMRLWIKKQKIFCWRLEKCFPSEMWESLWLLHDYYSFNTVFGIIMNGIASVPLMTLFSISTRDETILKSMWLASLRLPKLFRYREINKIFKNYLRVDHQESRDTQKDSMLPTP
jgi:hypothetical protein